MEAGKTAPNPAGRPPRHGSRSIAKSVTFNPDTLRRLRDLAATEYGGNLSECVNDLLGEELDRHDSVQAFRELAGIAGVELSEENIEKATRWWKETNERIERKKAEARLKESA